MLKYRKIIIISRVYLNFALIINATCNNFISLYIDYNQYTINQSVPVQQPNVKISEVNTKQYQKPKKVSVNEADKYNLNQDVQDYDIYENQVWRNISRSKKLNEIDKVFRSLFWLKKYFKMISVLCFRLSSIKISSVYPTVNNSGKKIVLVNRLFFAVTRRV